MTQEELDQLNQLPIRQQQPIIPPTVDPSMIASSTPTPNYNLAPTPIAPSQPTVAAMQQSQLSPPNINDYHPALKQRILAAIAGGFTGAANPQAGIQVASDIRNRDYNRALENYSLQRQHLTDVLGTEQQQYERGKEAATLPVQRLTALSGAEHRGSQDVIAGENIDIKRQDLARKQRADQIKGDYTKWRQDHPKLSDTQYLLSLPEEDQKDAIKTIHEINQGKKETPEEKAKDAGAVKTAQLQAEDTPLGQRVAAQSGVRTAATEAAKDTALVNRANDPKVLQAIKDIDTTKSDTHLGQQEKLTLDGAKEIMSQYPRVEANLDSLIASGEIDKTLGPRWHDFLVGTYGSDDPRYVALRTDLGLIQSKLSQIHTRGGSEQVLKKFQSLMNAGVMQGKTLKVSLDTVKNWIAEYAKDPRKYNDPNYYNKDLKTTQGGTKYEVIK